MMRGQQARKQTSERLQSHTCCLRLGRLSIDTICTCNCWFHHSHNKKRQHRRDIDAMKVKVIVVCFTIVPPSVQPYKQVNNESGVRGYFMALLWV